MLPQPKLHNSQITYTININLLITLKFKWRSLQMVLAGEIGIVLHTVTSIGCLPCIDVVIVIVSDIPIVSFVQVVTHL